VRSERRNKVRQTVQECLAKKATSTIGKRLGSLQRYVEYCSQFGISPFPLEGTNMHSYLENLVQLEDTAGTSGKSFLEAIRFTSAMPGLRSDEVHLISRRVAGLAEMLMKRAPTIAQAAPLTAEHVRRLERQCCCNAVNSTRNMHRLYTAS